MESPKATAGVHPAAPFEDPGAGVPGAVNPVRRAFRDPGSGVPGAANAAATFADPGSGVPGAANPAPPRLAPDPADPTLEIIRPRERPDGE